MGNTWNEKLTGAPPPHGAVLDKPSAGLAACAGKARQCLQASGAEVSACTT